MLKKLILAVVCAFSVTGFAQSIQAPPGGITTPTVVGKATATTDDPCSAGQYWIRPVAGAINSWRICNNGTVSNINSSSSVPGFVTATTTLQAAFNAACAANPQQGVFIPPTYTGVDGATNTCLASVLDARSMGSIRGGAIYSLADGGAVPIDFNSANAGTASASSSVVTASGYNCTTNLAAGRQLFLVGSGTAAADTTYTVTGCSGNNWTVSPNVVTAVSGVGIIIGPQIDSGPAMVKVQSKCGNNGTSTPYPACTILIPHGVYAFKTLLQFSGYLPADPKWIIRATGNEGAAGSYFLWYGADKAPMVQIGSSTVNDGPSYEKYNVGCIGLDSSHRPICDRLYSTGTNNRIAQNVYGSNTWQHISVFNSFFGMFENNTFGGAADDCIKSEPGGAFNNTLISHNEFNSCVGWAINHTNGGDTLRIDSNDFEGNGGLKGLMNITGSGHVISSNRDEMTNCVNDGTWRALVINAGGYNQTVVAFNQLWGGSGGNCATAVHNVDSNQANTFFLWNTWGNSAGTNLNLQNSNVTVFEPNLLSSQITNQPSNYAILSDYVNFGPTFKRNETNFNAPIVQIPGNLGGGFNGAASIAGGVPSSFSGQMNPTAATGTVIPQGRVIMNAAYNYVPGQPRSKFPYWIAGAAATFNGTTWNVNLDYGVSSQCLTVDGTSSTIASGTWSTCDYVRNTATGSGIKGWLNISGGTPGTWIADYAIDATAPPAMGATTPNTFKGTTINYTVALQHNGTPFQVSDLSDGANVVTQSSNAASGQMCTYTGANKVCVPSSAIPNGMTATTQSDNDNSTKPATTAYVDAHLVAANLPPVSVTVSTSTPVSVSGTGSAYYFNQHATAATAVTYNLPTAAAGKQFCFSNSFNGTAADTGVLTIATSASGQFIIFTDGTLTATGGNITSGGAAADAACVVGVDSTHWMLYVNRGTWTKH